MYITPKGESLEQEEDSLDLVQEEGSLEQELGESFESKI